MARNILVMTPKLTTVKVIRVRLMSVKVRILAMLLFLNQVLRTKWNLFVHTYMYVNVYM